MYVALQLQPDILLDFESVCLIFFMLLEKYSKIFLNQSFKFIFQSFKFIFIYQRHDMVPRNDRDYNQITVAISPIYHELHCTSYIGSDVVACEFDLRTLNHAAYKAGKNNNVNPVAMIKPPIIATAIGPQKTERDKGIIASTAAAAVNMIGRNRHTADSMTAVQGSTPASISCSIWSIKITELRMIITKSAITPNGATKPNGRCKMSNAIAAPATPKGPVKNTSNAREKLCSCNIRSVKIMKTTNGTFAAIESCAFPLSAAAPANSTL